MPALSPFNQDGDKIEGNLRETVDKSAGNRYNKDNEKQIGETIMSFHTGLVSISFRRYSVDEIIAACREAGLEWIEWGSDVHVPAGNLTVADEVAAQMKEAGLE